MFKHILLATDGSPESQHATRMAVNLTRVHGAKVTALYDCDPYPFMGLGEVNQKGPQDYAVAVKKLAAQAHAQVETRCTNGGAPVVFEALLMQDADTAHGIIEVAKGSGIDLVVMGSHGRSGVVRLVLGSVATRGVAESPVPVLVSR